MVSVSPGVAVGVAVACPVGALVAVAVGDADPVGVGLGFGMPCGPGPVGVLSPWQTVQSLNVPANPCNAMTCMLSSGRVLGRMA